jgi:hypothetical protein
MRRSITLLALAALLAAGPAWAGQQGGPGDDGNGPSGLVPGDSSKQGSYAGPATLEFRDIPNTGGGTLSNFGANTLRVTARMSDGDSFKMINEEFLCGDPAIADPCSNETVCVPGKGNKESCETRQVVDVRKVQEVQAVVLSLLVPQVISQFGLDPATVLEFVKIKGYVQTLFPVLGSDGVLSHFAVTDLVLAEQ